MKPETEIITCQGASARIFRDGPLYKDKKSLTIGEVNFKDALSGKTLLKQICVLAQEEDYSAVIGPMNGDTWHSYRLISKTDESNSFLLEPTSQIHDLKAFKEAGFSVISTYTSSRAVLKETLSDVVVSMPGISISPLEGETNSDLINTIFDFSQQSFANNAFYKPITREAFHALYEPLMGAIDRRFVLIAKTTNGQGVGFLFGIPDMLDQSQKTIILKTYASAQRGVGHFMVDHFHRLSIDAGFESVIHALMHQDNVSLTRSGQHQATPFREYALLAKEL